jgi:dihydroneopterin aldolase
VVYIAISAYLRIAGRTDELDDSINYSSVFRRVRAIVEDQRFDLLEALGEAIATALLTEFAAADSVAITVRKPGVALKGSILDSAGVRIRRDRAELGA